MKRIILSLCFFIFVVNVMGQDGLFVDDQFRLVVKRNNDAKLLSSAPFSATYYSLDNDRSQVGYKDFINNDGDIYQYLYYYNWKTDKKELIYGPSDFSSLPAFGVGNSAFFANDTLVVLDKENNTMKKIKMGYQVNQLRFVPGKKELISWLDQEGALKVYDWKNEMFLEVKFPYDKEAFQIEWNRDGNFGVLSTVDGHLIMVDFRDKKIIEQIEGKDPLWKTDDELEYLEVEYDSNRRPVSSSLKRFNVETLKSRTVAKFDSPVLTSKKESMDKRVVFYDMDRQAYEFSHNKNLKKTDLNIKQVKPDKSPRKMMLKKKASEVTIPGFDSIYFHQVYDVKPGVSNIGHGCCGAASTLMGLIYYGILEPWPVTCPSPYEHVSPYGYYITEEYRLNGTTFDVSYRGGKGIYGWIYRNSLEDTKGHMRDLISRHGLYSRCDWSPSFNKLITDIDQGFPFVVLNSLTSAGHYILATGYVPDKKVAIFNDPYGNKNTPGYPSYDGTLVKYDWPGWNNGHANLNTVWMFNYMRPAQDFCLDADYHYDSDSVYLNYEIKNAGLIPINTAFSVNVNLTDNGNAVMEKSFSFSSLDGLEKVDTSIVIPLNDLEKAKFTITCEGLNEDEDMLSNNNAIDMDMVFKTDSILPLTQQPENNEEILSDEVYIKVKFPSEADIVPEECKVFLDSLDCTEDAFLSTTYIRLKRKGLSNGEHRVVIKLFTEYGFSQDYSWSFTTKSQTPVSENMKREENRLKLYPNPVKEEFRVENLKGLNKIYLFDITGRTVLAKEFASVTKSAVVNVSSLPVGFYVVKMELSDERAIYRKITILR